MFQIRLRPDGARDRSALLARLRPLARARGLRVVAAEDVHEDGKKFGDFAEFLYLVPDGETSPSPTSALELVRDVASWPEVRDVVAADAAPHRAGRVLPGFEVGGVRFGGGGLTVVAGPCAVDDPAALPDFADELRRAGAGALRGGAWKPRTSPYAFQGLGAAGLRALAAARRASGLPVVTEVLDPRDLELAVEHADVLQIGSRNMHDGVLLHEAGATGLPVLVKRGRSASLDELLYALEYVAAGGSSRVLLCERGLRHFDPAVRNLLDLSAVPLLKQRTGAPVLVDPSHATGRAELVPPMMAAAVAAGADGLLVEVHPEPKRALSDAEQALDADAFRAAMRTVRAVLAALGRELHQPAPAPSLERTHP